MKKKTPNVQVRTPDAEVAINRRSTAEAATLNIDGLVCEKVKPIITR